MRSSSGQDSGKFTGGSRPCIVRAVVAFMLVVALLSLPARAGTPDDFVLVRNAKNETAIVSRAEMKDMSVGKRKTWGSGAAVQLVLPTAGSRALAWFASAVVGVSEGTLMSKIRQEVFKGELKKPVSAASDKETLSAVSADPGALGVVRADAARSLPAEVAILALR